VNYGPLIFLAAFFALSSSWFGLVLTPQIQLGRMQPTNSMPSGVTYPVGRPGLAQQGLEVYRANGCMYCHSQQVGQTGVAIEVVLSEAGTNAAALAKVVREVNPNISEGEAGQWLQQLPKPVLRNVSKSAGESAVKALNAAGGKATLWIAPTGPDLARGWGKRRSVAADYLYDTPVMLGSQRVGPDLANVGVRQPDANWHLRHLYAPRSEVKGSGMPPYRYLFEKRLVQQAPSRDALVLPPEHAPGAGYEVVPKAEAKALVAYLTSLRADAPLFVAPFSVAGLSPAATATNTPAAATDLTSTNAPAK
jgi:cbb3-type cytochrome oxidase cytochrome c subunit